MGDIMKIFKSLEDSFLLIKSVSEIFKKVNFKITKKCQAIRECINR